MRIVKISLALIMGMFISCDSDDSVLGSEHVEDYPLEVGNTWVYQWSSDDTNIPENLRNRTIRITITGKGDINGTETYKIETTADEEPELTSIHHYTLESNQLNLLAYKISAISDANARTNLMKANLPLGIADDGIDLTSELVIEEPPRIVLQYPLAIGNKWNHWVRDGTVMITKEVAKLTEVTVPAGTFLAYKVNNGGPWYKSNGIKTIDFVSNIGLIKRTTSFDQTLTDEEGNETGEKSINITVELMEFSK